jgi:hypothetical protein
MSLENPNVQIKTETPFGVQFNEIKTDHNQSFGQLDDWKYSLVKRLAFSPRLEVAIADSLLWLSSSSMVAVSIAGLLALGVPLVAIQFGAVIILIPILLWAKWVEANMHKSFQNIIGARLLLVLIGFLIAILFGVF